MCGEPRPRSTLRRWPTPTPRYAAERDACLPAGHLGPRPSGGVGGTRTGVKCLHAHYAWHLAGGDDPVGRWVARQLALVATATSSRERRRHRHRHQLGAAAGHRRHERARSPRDHDAARPRRRRHPPSRTPTPSPAPSPAWPSCGRRSTSTRWPASGRWPRRCCATSTTATTSWPTPAGCSAPTLEVLDGEEEALLGFLGATAELEPERGPFLVLDIGGGSTELSVGVDHPEASVSLAVGSVAAHRDAAPPRSTAARGAHQRHRPRRGPSRRRPPRPPRRWPTPARSSGVAGTIVSIAAVELGSLRPGGAPPLRAHP